MKKLLIILCLISSNAMAGNYEYKKGDCEDLKQSSYTRRCENDEAICYRTYEGGLQCKFKIIKGLR